MKWIIPAKTFLVGEYIAISGGPAIVLTTAPCFEVTLSDALGATDIHEESPAGKLWGNAGHQAQLVWSDPYQGLGGMGASSAQFLGAYLADAYLQNQSINLEAMLAAYIAVAWSGEGARPSGYDVLAQASHECVLIHRQKMQYASHTWPFSDIDFLLVHTGQKLATHHYLKGMCLPDVMESLTLVSLSAMAAFQRGDSVQLVDAVNAYHESLSRMNLVASHTLAMMQRLSDVDGVLAMKGCGAMGADVLLLIVSSDKLHLVKQKLVSQGDVCLATSTDLYHGTGFGL
jgi:mevalonate kinase